MQVAESKMATLKAAHEECLLTLRKRIVANEEFLTHPEKFLEQLIKVDLSGFDTKKVLEQAFPNVTMGETVSVAFDQLQYSCFNHCLNPELLIRLAEIIEAFEMVEEQKRRVHEYCASLTVDDFINMREHNPFSTTPSKDLAKMVIKLEEKWLSCTMEQVLQGISKFCDIANIPKFLCRLHQIQRGCIAISILVPNDLITDLLRSRVQKATAELEDHRFVEVKAKDEVLFCVEDQRVGNEYNFM